MGKRGNTTELGAAKDEPRVALSLLFNSCQSLETDHPEKRYETLEKYSTI